MKRFFSLLAGLAFMLVAASSARAVSTVIVLPNNALWGTVTGSGVYADTASVTITASANTNYVFTGWSNATVTNPSSPTTTLIATGVITVYANFTPKTNTLYVTASPSVAGLVAVLPVGTVTGTGQYSYPVSPTSTVTLVATPSGALSASGTPYVFSGWTVVSGSVPSYSTPTTSSTTSFPMDNSYVLIANFVSGASASYRISIVDDPSPTVTGVQGGTVKLADGTAMGLSTATYAPGTTVRIVAVPAYGYQYAGFTGASITSPVTPASGDALQNTANARVGEMVINADRSIYAHFEPIKRQLSIVASPSTAGTVSFAATPVPLSSSSDTSKIYAYGSTVPINATPNATYRLVSWGTTDTTNAPLTVTTLTPPSTSTSTTSVGPLQAAAVVTAYFEPIPVYHALTLTASTGGTATAVGSYVNPDTHTTTSISLSTASGGVTTVPSPGVLDNTTVTLTAVPQANWAFVKWNGPVQNPTVSPNTLNVTADAVIQPVFVQTYAALTITYDLSAAQTAGAKVTVTGATPNTGLFYPIGSNLVLTATAPSGWRFTGWGGALNGTTSPQSLPFTGDTSVTAKYVRTWSLTATATNGGLVQVGSAAAVANYPTTTFDEGTSVNLVAVAPSGTIFSGWTGVDSSSGTSANVNMVAAKNVTASFNVVNNVTLAASTGGTASMSGLSGATIVPLAVAAGGSTGGAYNSGATLSLSATPNSGWKFVGWDLNGSGTVAGAEPTATSTSVTVTTPPAAGNTIKALFTPITHTLTVSISPATATAAGVTVTGNLGTYNENDVATLTANAVAGWPFQYWIIDGINQGAAPATTTISMTKDRTAVAVFGPQYTFGVGLDLSNDVTPALAGGAPQIIQLNPSVSSASLPSSGTVTLPGLATTVVTLKANAATNYIFNKWTLYDSGGNVVTNTSIASFNVNGSGDGSLTLTGATGQTYTAKAKYTRTYNVTTGVIPTGGGNVSPSSGTKTVVPYGTNFTITATSATPAGGWYRTDTGATVTNASNTYTFLPVADTTVSAVFTSSYTLTINPLVSINTSTHTPIATVTPSPVGPTYSYNQSVTLTSTQTELWRWADWNSTTNSAVNPTTVTMSAAKTVTSRYNEWVPFTMAVSPSTTYGKITGAAASTNTILVASTANTNGVGISYQKAASSVTIVASPNTGYGFVSWATSTGAAPTSLTTASTTVTADVAKTLTATFAPSYTVAPTAEYKPSGSGATVTVNATSNTSTFIGTRTVAVVATVPSGYAFTGWRLTNSAGTTVTDGTFADPTAASTTLTIAGAVSGVYKAVAQFSKTYTVTIGQDNPAMGTVSPSGTITVPYNQTVTVTASSVPGGGWYYRPASTAASTATVPTVTGLATYTSPAITGDATILAIFQATQKLTIIYNPTNSGVAPNAATVALSPNTPTAYAYGAKVTLTASTSTNTTAAGWTFDSWTSNVGTTSSSATQIVGYVIMNGDQTVTVNYKPKYVLTMARTPSAIATNTTTPVTGNVSYQTSGNTVNLSATAGSGYGFKSWSSSAGAAPASTVFSSTTIYMDADKIVTAAFAPTATVTVKTVTQSGLTAPFTSTPGTDGTFSTVSSGAGGTAGAYNTATLANYGLATAFVTTTVSGTSYTGDAVTVNATPNAGYDFIGWDANGDGEISGSDSTSTSYTFTPTAATTITAIFKRKIVTLNILLTPTDAGTATATTNASITAPGAQSYSVLYGDTVTVNAAPTSVYTFTNWTGATFANANNASTTLAVNGDTTITANFTLIPGNVDIYLFPDPSPTYGDVSATALSGNPLTGGGYVTINGNQARHYVGTTGQTVQVSAAGKTLAGVAYGFSVWNGADTNPGDGALLQDRTNSPTTFVATPLTGKTDIRIKATFVPIVPGGFYANLTVRASLDGALLPTGTRGNMPDNWTATGSMLDTGVTPNRAWIRLYEIFVTATHRYGLNDAETLTVAGPATQNSFDFTGWDITYYNGDGSVNSTTTTTNLAAVPAFNIPNNVTHNVVAVAKFITAKVNLTVSKHVTGPDSALLTAQATLTSVTPNGTLTSAIGATPQVSQWLRTSTVPSLVASLGGSTDYVFDGWDVTGDAIVDFTGTTVGNTPTTWGPLNTNLAATAYFTRLNNLTVAVSPGDATGTGTINTVGLVNGVQAPAGPTSNQYRNGTSISVLATPAVHNVLRGWKIETDLDDNGSLETVTNVAVADATTPQTYPLPTLLHATKITAIFALENIPTTFIADPVNTGTITFNGGAVTLPYTKADAHYGDVFNIVATPDSAHLFDRWTVNAVAGASNASAPLVASTTVFTDVAKTITAHFVPKSVLTMTATPNTPATLSILTPTAGTHDYPTGTTVTISVGVPDIHYVFQGWVINGVPTGTASDTSLAITLAGDTVASATFQERSIITANVFPTNSGGSVVADGAVTTTPGQYLYTKGAPVSVTASPGSGPGITANGYIFDHWEVNGVTTPGANPFTIASLVNDTVVTAVYKLHPGYDVTLQSNVVGGGQTLTATDGTTLHNYLTTPGAGRYPWHAIVTVNAVPSTGYVFANWIDSGGNVVSTAPSFTLPQLDASVNLTAVFLPSYRVNVISRTFPTTAPTGGAVTILSPAPGGSSVTLLGAAQIATLSATPAAGYVFGGWKLETAAGAASSAGTFADATQSSTVLTISGQPGENYNAVAIFNKILAITSKVSDSTQGSVSPAGVTNLPYGSTLTLTATGLGTHVPTGWYYQNAAQLAAGTGSIVSTSNPYTVTATEDATLTALFQGKYVLTVQYDPVGASSGATPASVGLTPVSVGNNYDYNTTVTLTATNTQRWQFDSWSGPVSSTTALTTTTTLTQDQTVIAHYLPRYPLALATNPTNSGTTTPDVSLPNYYTIGTVAPISVVPKPGYQFLYWTNDVGAAVASPTSTTTSVVVDMVKTVTANMMKLWAVTVQPPSVGVGPTNPVAGVYWVTPTDASAGPNGLFTVTALPAASQGWEFDSWGSTGNITFVNGTTRETATATILAAGDATLQPKYRLKRYDLTVTITPAGASSAATSPLGFLPSVSTASARYEYGTVATISLGAAHAGFQFNSWQGDPVVIPNLSDPQTATILMNGDKHVTASYDQTRTLTILSDPADGSGGKGTGAGTYVINQSVPVTAVPAAGWRFRYWAGPVTVSSNAATTITMTDDRTILAAFEIIPPSADLTVMTPVGGTVTIDGSSPTTSTTVNLETGSSHTVTATANPGYVFDTWSATGPTSVTISSSASPTTSVIFNSTGTLIAYFKPKTVLLIVNYDPNAGAVAISGGTLVPGTTNQYIFSPTDTPTLTATAKATTDGSTNSFSRWETDGLNTISANQINVQFAPTDTVRTVSAFFSTKTASNWTLAVDASPPSLGSASKTLLSTDKYQLTATPSVVPGNIGEFLGWEDNSGLGNLLDISNSTVTVAKPTTGLGAGGEISQLITARFQRSTSDLEVQVVGLGTVVAGGVSFPSSYGTGVLAAQGSTVIVSAQAATGWKLTSWNIDGITYPASGNTGTASVVLNNLIHTVVVTFTPDLNYLLTVTLISKVGGSQSTVLSGSSQAGDLSTNIVRITDKDQYMTVTVQLDPNVSENTVSVPPEFQFEGRVGNVLTYRVLVNKTINATIVLGPTNPSLVMSVNPPDAGTALIYASVDLNDPNNVTPMTPAVSVGSYTAGSKVKVKFVPATADDVFLSWKVLEGAPGLASDYNPADPSSYTVTLSNSSAVTRLEANVQQQRRSFLSRPTVDIKDTNITQPTAADVSAGANPILLPDTKIDDREKKTPTHLISGRETDPSDPTPLK